MIKTLPRIFGVAAIIIVFFVTTPPAQVAAGGVYTLDQTVVAAGGGTSLDTVGNAYKIEGTNGQPVAGTFSGNGIYSVRGGFWAANPLAPTAAGANVGGRVVGVGGEGLRNISVILTGGTLLVPRQARTNSFGNFTFEDVEVGQTYVLSVQNKKYGFPQTSQILSVMDNVTDIVFRAAWEN